MRKVQSKYEMYFYIFNNKIFATISIIQALFIFFKYVYNAFLSISLTYDVMFKATRTIRFVRQRITNVVVCPMFLEPSGNLKSYALKVKNCHSYM